MRAPHSFPVTERQRQRQPWRLLALALVAVLPAGCATLQPVKAPAANPFAGAWSTGEHQQIAFRNDTVVLSPPGEPPTPMSAATCDGRFRLGYGDWTREALLAQTMRQPEVNRRLEKELVRAQYPIADVSCGEGGTTYVLLDDRNILAIHRDRDVAGLERLSRP